jgi:putative endonuclease
MFFVYAIQSKTCGRIYIGHSECVERRLQQHNAGRVPSTKDDRPWALLRSEELTTRSEARWLERQLKQSRGRRLRWLGK